MVAKTRFRQEALAERRQMSPLERSQKSGAVAERLLTLGLLRPGATVCFYLATPDEVETRPLVSKAREVGCRVVLPKVVGGGNLELYPVMDLSTEVEKGPFGIDEPIGDTRGLVPPGAVDCFIVPGVAFDTSGRRCGFGHGSFDRLLARRSAGARVVALAFECQLKAALPADEHDVLMDIICTEERVVHCRRPSVGPWAESQPAVGKEGNTP